jgi:pullulanase/glycogen debranching enzyme
MGDRNVVEYIKSLRVTAVELLQIQSFVNCGGQQTIGFFAPRHKYPILRRTRFFAGEYNEQPGVKDIAWIGADGGEMQQAEWGDACMKCLGMLLDGRAQVSGIRDAAGTTRSTPGCANRPAARAGCFSPTPIRRSRKAPLQREGVVTVLSEDQGKFTYWSRVS